MTTAAAREVRDVVSRLVLAAIDAKLAVPGLHHWPAAPDAVKYLRDPHRHMFVIRGRKQVSHMDRDIEFILLGHQMRQHLVRNYPVDPSGCVDFGTRSCEMIATELLMTFELDWCSVHEDDENGAIVRFSSARPLDQQP